MDPLNVKLKFSLIQQIEIRNFGFSTKREVVHTITIKVSLLWLKLKV